MIKRLLFLAVVCCSAVNRGADVNLSLVSSNQFKTGTNNLYLALSGLINTNNINTTNIVNVQSYGAFGDNVTDNQIPLSNSWKAVGANNIWFLPPGDYQSSRLSLSSPVKSSYTISGKGATLRAATTNSFFLLLTGTNITFQDITFDLNQKSSIGIFANNQSKGWKFRNCRFLNGYADNNIDPGGSLGVLGVDIARGCSDFEFNSCTFSNFTFSSVGNIGRFCKGIYGTALGGTFPADADRNFIIRGCFFYNIVGDGATEGDSIEFSFPNGGESFNVEIANCIFRGYTKRAIKMQYAGFNINGNIFNSLLTGVTNVNSINTTAIGGFGRGVIANNIIEGQHVRGIMVSSTGTNNAATNIVITGNQIYGTAVNTVTNLTGIDVMDGATNILVANNIVDNFFNGLGVHGDTLNVHFRNNIVTSIGSSGALVTTNGNVTSGTPTKIYFSGNDFEGGTNGVNAVQGSGVYANFNTGLTSSTFINYAVGVTGAHLFNGTLPAITSATLDFPSIGAQTNADLTISVTGAAVNDTVSLGLPAAPTSGISFNAFVSSADTVTVRAYNFTGGSIDPASASYKVTVIKD